MLTININISKYYIGHKWLATTIPISLILSGLINVMLMADTVTMWIVNLVTFMVLYLVVYFVKYLCRK